jgi:osmotically-inducible protein OsmY
MRNQSTIKWLWTAVLGSMAVLAGTAAIAQSPAAAERTSTTTSEIPASPEHGKKTDQQLQDKVQNALSSDAYFYGAHVDVSLENGNVVLRGFVFSDWDLRDAIRIATKAADGRRVVDNLTIEVGGRR